MSKRHPENPNLILHKESTYKGLPVITQRGPLIDNYLSRIYETIQSALSAHSRVFCIRFDLHLPVSIDTADTKLISRFFDSLKAQIKADQQRSVRRGQRRHTEKFWYVWVKEHQNAMFWHYHVLVLFNQDAYRWIGDYGATDGNMAARFKKAWASALGMEIDQVAGLVHFPENPAYHLNTNTVPYILGLPELFYRVSYFAKMNTKHYGDCSNHFGCSRF